MEQARDKFLLTDNMIPERPSTTTEGFRTRSPVKQFNKDTLFQYDFTYVFPSIYHANIYEFNLFNTSQSINCSCLAHH